MLSYHDKELYGTYNKVNVQDKLREQSILDLIKYVEDNERRMLKDGDYHKFRKIIGRMGGCAKRKMK